jgi:hypothetical protein
MGADILQALRTLAHGVCLLALATVTTFAQPTGQLAGVVGDVTVACCQA